MFNLSVCPLSKPQNSLLILFHLTTTISFATFKLFSLFFCRTAKLAIPETAAGEKVPVVFHLHGKKQFVLYCYDNLHAS